MNEHHLLSKCEIITLVIFFIKRKDFLRFKCFAPAPIAPYPHLQYIKWYFLSLRAFPHYTSLHLAGPNIIEQYQYNCLIYFIGHTDRYTSCFRFHTVSAFSQIYFLTIKLSSFPFILIIEFFLLLFSAVGYIPAG